MTTGVRRETASDRLREALCALEVETVFDGDEGLRVRRRGVRDLRGDLVERCGNTLTVLEQARRRGTTTRVAARTLAATRVRRAMELSGRMAGDASSSGSG